MHYRNFYRVTAARRALPLVLLLCVAPATAEEEDTPLYERRPYDLVVLRDSPDGLEVLPIGPDDANARVIRARLASNPGVEVEIARSSVVRIEPFPQRLLTVAQGHVAAKRFGDAFDHFARLERDFPNTDGFAAAFDDALLREAAARARAGVLDHALAILMTLAERNPNHRDLPLAVDRIGDRLITQRWDTQDFIGVRAVVDSLQSQFRGIPLTVGQKWIGRLDGGADEQLVKARSLAERGLTREALRVLNGAQALAPDSVEVNNLLEEISASGRTLWVGVWEAPGETTPADLDRPAARRQSRLLGGQLGVLDDVTQAGCEFRSEAARIDFDDDRRQLRLDFPAPVSARGVASLARVLLDTSPTRRDALGLLRARAATVSATVDGGIEIDLRTPHPKPMALAALPLPVEAASLARGAWRRVDIPAGGEAAARYERASGEGAFDVIEEYVYDDADEAIAALAGRRLHVLANTPGWKLAALEATPGVRLTPRRTPTLHCLLVREGSAFAARRELRRMLCYAIAREQLLEDLIGGGERRSGFEPLSGPVTLGTSSVDPLRYAYDVTVTPRPYDPRLAALLLSAARAADLQDSPPGGGPRPPDVPTAVTLVHPPTPRGRAVAEAIYAQLTAIGLGLQLREATEQAVADGDIEYDLRLAELDMAEPLVDMWRLLGPGGIAGECSPAMRDALERVASAANQRPATQALKTLHRIAYDDLPLVPLWQTVDHVAFRSSLIGTPETVIDLYGTVDVWSDGPEEAP